MVVMKTAPVGAVPFLFDAGDAVLRAADDGVRVAASAAPSIDIEQKRTLSNAIMSICLALDVNTDAAKWVRLIDRPNPLFMQAAQSGGPF